MCSAALPARPRWAYGLLKETAPVLLDGSADETVIRRIREAVETGGDARIADLHVWRVGPSAYAVIVALVSHSPHPPEYYKQKLSVIPGLEHVSVEINPCTDAVCAG